MTLSIKTLGQYEIIDLKDTIHWEWWQSRFSRLCLYVHVPYLYTIEEFHERRGWSPKSKWRGADEDWLRGIHRPWRRPDGLSDERWAETSKMSPNICHAHYGYGGNHRFLFSNDGEQWIFREKDRPTIQLYPHDAAAHFNQRDKNDRWERNDKQIINLYWKSIRSLARSPDHARRLDAERHERSFEDMAQTNRVIVRMELSFLNAFKTRREQWANGKARRSW